MDERALRDLNELARRDADLSDRAERLRGLDAAVASVRGRAETIDAFFAAYPDEEARRRGAEASAAGELERRRVELAAAEAELEAARDDDGRERAASMLARARDHVAVAEAALVRAASAAAELERDASALPAEVPLLEARALAIAEEVDVLPPPGGVRDLVEWASRAHAELFVATRQLDAQRDRVVREANELATMLLGEPTYGSSVRQLAERVLPLAGE